MTGFRSIFAALAAAAALQAPGASAQQAVKFTLDWRFEGPGALFLLPAAKGYFKAEGLDVTIDSGAGSAGAVNRIATGGYDMGFADLAALIEFLANNPANKTQAVFMVYETAPAAIFTLKKSGIAKPADLAGKNIGAPPFDAARKAWPIFAKAVGLKTDAVTWQNMDPALREQLLVRGEVPAISGFYFTGYLNLLARGAKPDEIVAFKYGDHGVKLYGNAVMVSEKFAAANPKAVTGFLRALRKGIADVVAKPDEGIAAVKARDGLIDVKLETERLKLMIADQLDKSGKFGGAVDKAQLEKNIADVVDAFGLKAKPAADQVFNASFLPK
ncbi:MAG: ABC transporter substrate-binding protein [Candidatus Odyssella sp.]|nr:ABC transporter substrate-binding protein [Candidatus Odyssella sp.]